MSEVFAMDLPGDTFLTTYSTPPYNEDTKEYFKFRPFFEKVSHIKDSIGVEVGVFEGYNSLGVCRFCQPKKLYLVDPYKVYEEILEQTYTEFTQAYWDEMFDSVQKRLKDLPVEFVRKPSVEAVGDVPNELDYVYIDGDHNTNALIEDLDAWHPKVKAGGMLGGHDAMAPEVRDALALWLYDKKDQYNYFYHFGWNDWWIIKV